MGRGYSRKDTWLVVRLFHIEKRCAKKMKCMAEAAKSEGKCKSFWWLQAAGVPKSEGSFCLAKAKD